MLSARSCKLAAVAALAVAWSCAQLSCSTRPGGATGLSAHVPADLAKPNPSQEDFDELAWRLFVALNWPARHGRADEGKVIGQLPQAARVWETFTDPGSILKTCDENSQTTYASDPESDKRLRLSRKRIERLGGGDDLQAAPSWPLIDQRGNYALYEIRVNEVQRHYITSNKLTSPAEIGSYARPISFPDGSIEVKAAWRLFPPDTPADVLARYHRREATINVPENESATGKAFEVRGTVGLVGLHIVYKTKSQPKWMWATFEHVDNYEISPAHRPPPGLKPTFNSGAAAADEINRQPKPRPTAQPSPAPSASPAPSPTPLKYLWSQQQPTAGLYEPTEAARCPNEIAPPSAANARWQQRLAAVEGVENSPWQYYALNLVQWFDAQNQIQPRNGDGVPVARNSALETYILGDQKIASQVPAVGPVNSDPPLDPPVGTLADTIVATMLAAEHPEKTGSNTWSSCVLCHQMALYEYEPGKDVMTDYSFVFRSYLPAGGKCVN